MSVHDSHWLRMDDERHITGCQCGFMADENDCGYGDSVLKHIANEALTEAADAIDHRRYRRKSDWRIGLGELDIYIDAADIVRARTT